MLRGSHEGCNSDIFAARASEALGRTPRNWPARLKSKDSGDVALLMMVSDPTDVARIMVDATSQHPETADVVTKAASWLIEMYGEQAAIPRQHAADSLSTRFDEATVADVIDSWLTTFASDIASLVTGATGNPN